MSKKLIYIVLISVFALTSCFSNFSKQANEQFGDQHFKTAIALIELYKVREGHYPETLDSLKYLGNWDMIIFPSIKYQKLEDGYELDLVNGFMGAPDSLKLPDGFWKGLGLKKSNMKN